MYKNLLLFLATTYLYGGNQTSSVTIPFPEDSLPYRLHITRADFSLPIGLHSFVSATYKGEWLLLSGRTNGLHDVDNLNPNDNSFPVPKQNTSVMVINPQTGQMHTRSLLESSSGLTQKQIEQLSVTNALFYQAKDGLTLYMVGGYGWDTALGRMSTKDSLTAIDVPSIIKWVKRSSKVTKVSKCIREVSNPLLQVTGGVMWKAHEHQPCLLAFGQNFDGNYTATSEGSYTSQVRPFQIIDTGTKLYVQPYKQPTPLPTYRRRDLNVIPIIKKIGGTYKNGFTTLSGVFTPGGDDNPGAWTVPIEIYEDGSSRMLDPSNSNTLAQGMNNYSCPNVGLFSQKTQDMYMVLFGGLSYMIVSDGNQASCVASPPPTGGTYTMCENIPFVNDVTTVKINSEGNYSQYLMSEKFPTITAHFGTGSGTSPIWFGTSAAFFLADKLPLYSNNVIAFDKLKNSSIFLGYIVGGIASSQTDTNFADDSQASSYVFTVTLDRID